MSEPADPFAAAAREHTRRIAEHAEVPKTKRYEDAQLHLRRLTQDFLVALRASWFVFTRYPDGKHWLLQNAVDDLMESAVAIPMLVEQGIFSSARRELRYMLEATVKYVYVDQQLGGDTPLEDRIAYLGDTSRVPRSSISPINDLTIRMLDDRKSFRDAVTQAFGALSGYVHPSQKQLGERLKRAERGEYSGLEGPGVIEAYIRLASQTLDLVLVLVFEGIGPSFTGDVFVQLFDDEPKWKFHRTRYMAQVSKHFEYKMERHPD